MTERYTTTDGGAPGAQRRAVADCRPRRSDPAAGPLPDRADGAVQPGAHPGTSTARQGRRRVRPLRGDQRRQQVHQGRGVPAGHQDRHADRFSTVAGERGSPDTWRDPRGFALKFYTSEGNFDMVGNNTPVFFMRDPLKFQHFIRSQKRMQATNLRDHNMQWDFWSLSPESAHQVTWLMGDRGIPKTWRHMNGYSSHTYSWINAADEIFWVKYHFISRSGHRLPDPGGRRPAGRRGRRLPPARPVRRRSRAATSRAGR